MKIRLKKRRISRIWGKLDSIMVGGPFDGHTFKMTPGLSLVFAVGSFCGLYNTAYAYHKNKTTSKWETRSKSAL